MFTTNSSGGVRLFRLFGIEVYLHWSWLLIALWSFQSRMGHYQAPYWAALEYGALFLIVLMHEFGHALACRSVGGYVGHILLWPLGGIAYVNPPPRPGPVLWSISAGPLVNLALAPLLWAATVAAGHGSEDLAEFAQTMYVINWALLIFNLLPIYPLDGGQIFQSLLWFVIGRAYSLMVAAVVGLVGAAGIIILSLLWAKSVWLALLAAFGAMASWQALQQSRWLTSLRRLPRREELACPQCGQSPPRGTLWRCEHCGQGLDVFMDPVACPHCGTAVGPVPCLECGRSAPPPQWVNSRPSAVGSEP